MIKSRLLLLIMCFTLSCFLVAGLYFISLKSKEYLNGFLRKLPPHKIVGTGFVKLPGRAWYFAGGDVDNVFLGNKLYRNKLMQLNIPAKSSMIKTITGFDTVKLSLGFKYLTESTTLYRIDGNKPVICSGNLSDGKLSNIYKSPYFLTALPLGNGSFALTVVNRGTENAIVKMVNGGISKPLSLMLPGDNIFSSDGKFIKDSRSSRFFYIYHYRNKFLCLDTNLNIIYTGNTIDTVKNAKIKVGVIKSSHQITLASPPLFVNEQSCANNQYVFIHSGIKADNEINEEIDEANPIDITESAMGNINSASMWRISTKRNLETLGYMERIWSHYTIIICTSTDSTSK